MSIDNSAAVFESGVAQYFKEFSHRLARETTHQAWLLTSVSKLIDPQLVVAELNVPNRDLSPFAEIEPSRGAISFDFAITRSEIDLRTWKARTPGWNAGETTAPQTLETLREVAVLAEFKIAESSSTKTSALVTDLEKLRGAIGFMAHHGCATFPSCFLLVLDPHRVLDTRKAIEAVAPNWPACTSFPKVLVLQRTLQPTEHILWFYPEITPYLGQVTPRCAAVLGCDIT